VISQGVNVADVSNDVIETCSQCIVTFLQYSVTDATPGLILAYHCRSCVLQFVLCGVVSDVIWNELSVSAVCTLGVLCCTAVGM